MFGPTPQDYASWRRLTDACVIGFPSGEHQHWTQENLDLHWMGTLFTMDWDPFPRQPLGVWHILYACPVPTCGVAQWDRSRCAGERWQRIIVRETEVSLPAC
jgi:hypothetical protein